MSLRFGRVLSETLLLPFAVTATSTSDRASDKLHLTLRERRLNEPVGTSAQIGERSKEIQ
jgi:hypothetical protein